MESQFDKSNTFATKQEYYERDISVVTRQDVNGHSMLLLY